jgi:serine/threonine-protein kinase
MATVYLADLLEEGGTTRRVALKKPHAFLAADPATLAVLEDEAQLGACIRHPNVVGVLELVRGDEPALVMEWVEGVDLAALVRATQAAGRRLPVDVAAAIARDMLAGLHAAHGARRADGLALHVVHRDVSPQNVLVGLDGVVRVADFGVAKAMWRQQHTEEGSVKGKLGYLAPEQLGGRCDHRSDVFAVGAVLWELLTGTRMRTGDGVEMLVGILSGIVPAPSSVVAEAAALDAVVLRALERCPEERFATAAAMAEAIEQSVSVASPARVAEVVRDLVATPAPQAAELAETEVTSEDATNEPTVRIACVRPGPLPARCAPRPLATFRLPPPPPHPAFDRRLHRGFEPLTEPARRVARTSGAPRRAA